MAYEDRHRELRKAHNKLGIDYRAGRAEPVAVIEAGRRVKEFELETGPLVDDLAAAVRDWWEHKRPVAWSEANHRANPTVNCVTDREREMALMLAALDEASGPGEVGRGD